MRSGDGFEIVRSIEFKEFEKNVKNFILKGIVVKEEELRMSR